MAKPPGPLPQVNTVWVYSTGVPSQWFREYMATLDQTVRALNPVIAVAVPTNANAATAGVALGSLYTDTADPAKVYIRTV